MSASDDTLLLARLQSLEVLFVALMEETSRLAPDRRSFAEAVLKNADKHLLKAMATAPKEYQAVANASRETLKAMAAGIRAGLTG